MLQQSHAYGLAGTVPRGLKKDGKVLLRSCWNGVPLATCPKSLGTHVKIQTPSSSELEAVSEAWEHDFYSSPGKSEAQVSPSITALGCDGGKVGVFREKPAFL